METRRWLCGGKYIEVFTSYSCSLACGCKDESWDENGAEVVAPCACWLQRKKCVHLLSFSKECWKEIHMRDDVWNTAKRMTWQTLWHFWWPVIGLFGSGPLSLCVLALCDVFALTLQPDLKHPTLSNDDDVQLCNAVTSRIGDYCS